MFKRSANGGCSQATQSLQPCQRFLGERLRLFHLACLVRRSTDANANVNVPLQRVKCSANATAGPICLITQAENFLGRLGSFILLAFLPIAISFSLRRLIPVESITPKIPG